jgi:ceramide glucosyltransferase
VIALAVAWALVATGFTAYTLAALGRRRRVMPAGAPPDVLLLRPADALTPHELETLALPLAYDGAVEHVVLCPTRPALPPGIDWRCSDPAAPNRKVGHLLHGLDTIPAGDRVVMSIDADVRVDGALLASPAAALRSGAALATAAPSPEAAPGLVAHAVRALLCHTHLSFAALDAVSVGAKSICGKAMALSPAAQSGLRALRDHVGEDLELGRWLHVRGLPVVLAAVPARLPQEPHGPFGPARDRFTRWMQVLRAHRPGLSWTVPVLFTPSLPLLMLGLEYGTPVLAAVLLLWVARTALALGLERAGALWWPLGEGLLLLAFVRSLGLRTVTWRGRRFRLRRGGRMQPVAP